jgi:hypothetical protein
VALVVGYALLQARRKRYALRFTTVGMLDKVAPDRPGWRRHLTALGLIVAVIVATLAFAKPVIAGEVVSDSKFVILAIDTSISMEATDVPPTRIDAARDAAGVFLDSVPEGVAVGDYVAVNDYEGKMLEEKTGRKLELLAREVDALVCTLGAKGSLIFAGGKRHEVPPVPADAVVDPTGCGDAYRAGLLYGIAREWDWASTGKLGAVMGALKIAQRGAQNHTTSRDDAEACFRKAFGYSPWKG